MTEEQFAEWGMEIGVGALVLFMIFIIWDLGRRSHAGKFGMMILFIGLGVGILGFLIKVVITYMMEQGGV